MIVIPSAEHFVILLAFLFPPVLITILIVLLLATFGKSFGIREIYVRGLLWLFEWGAGEISTAKQEEEFSSDSPLKPPVQNGMRQRTASSQSIIERSTDVNKIDEIETHIVNNRGQAVLEDSLYFLRAGIETIVEDDVTCRFEAEQLTSWNMLTRTQHIFYEHINWRLSLLYCFGFVFRYGFLLPLRLIIFGIGMLFLILSTAVIGLFPEGRLKAWLNEKSMLSCSRIISRCVTALIYFHDRQNKAKNGGICVANHTSPIDVMMLSTDHCYALIGQIQPGLLGFIQRALSRATNHIWFERSESRDRSKVATALRKHAENPNNLPVLIFPEGTCINNTSVMQFKKGSFEANQTVYPIAMKYDSRFGDAFWNSSNQGWFEYLIHMMSSWAIICNVWYLPPMQKNADEDAIAFANRVKKTIAERGGMVDLEWDGQLKRTRVSSTMIEKTRAKYFNRLTRYEDSGRRNSTDSIPSDSGDISRSYLSKDNLLASSPSLTQSYPSPTISDDEAPLTLKMKPTNDTAYDFFGPDQADQERENEPLDQGLASSCGDAINFDTPRRSSSSGTTRVH